MSEIKRIHYSPEQSDVRKPQDVLNPGATLGEGIHSRNFSIGAPPRSGLRSPATAFSESQTVFSTDITPEAGERPDNSTRRESIPRTDAHRFLVGVLGDPRRVAAITSPDEQVSAPALHVAKTHIAHMEPGHRLPADTLPDARLEVASRLITGLVRDPSALRRDATLKLLPHVGTKGDDAPVLQWILVRSIAELDKVVDPHVNADALLRASKAVAQRLPHDADAGKEIVRSWTQYVEILEDPYERYGILEKVGAIFSRDNSVVGLRSDEEREWRDSAIVAVADNFPRLSYAQVGSLFGLSSPRVGTILKEAEALSMGTHEIREK